MRGLDAWISRGHERDDTPPAYQCAQHGYQADDYPCPECEDAAALHAALAVELGPAQVTGELLKAVERAMTRVKANELERKGVWLHAREGKR